MEWRKTDGGIIDAELLRPRDWIASSNLEVGSIFKVFSTELELNGVAEVTAISPCPPLSAGDGEVVTGRFVTRRADETVRMTFETGDILEGSKSHPIWSPAIQDWVPMEEWTAGDAVLGREGWITVTSVEVRTESVPLYNIEVHGEHVYQVTEAGILVHNSGVCVVDTSIAAVDEAAAVMMRRLKRLGYDDANATRIMKSIANGEEVVIIGEKMARVQAVARMVRMAGGRAVTYAPRNFSGLNRSTMEANRSWIRYWEKLKGRPVIDIGRQPTIRPDGPSPFYGMENRSLDKWHIYTPF